jgi:hypothetical protein
MLVNIALNNRSLNTLVGLSRTSSERAVTLSRFVFHNQSTIWLVKRKVGSSGVKLRAWSPEYHAHRQTFLYRLRQMISCLVEPSGNSSCMKGHLLVHTLVEFGGSASMQRKHLRLECLMMIPIDVLFSQKLRKGNPPGGALRLRFQLTEALVQVPSKMAGWQRPLCTPGPCIP